ncbi:hypothetical protein SY83_04405 [Paenibacillus swuensis]|uniref:Alpha-galactosidase n=1 Tax=Paenibacillus swuensis TaxID=1178515 RepID=A0A172TFF4_9BACL|nr:hypothetical protein [Paenibacillus swuensis]ANE45666.1 hypothetical protein SY83_04405 [Paenibacillus swuensis]
MIELEKIKFTRSDTSVALDNGVIQLSFDTAHGTWSASWSGHPLLSELHYAFEADGELIRSTDAIHHTIQEPALTPITDGHGTGACFTIAALYANGLTAATTFCVYEELPYFFLQSVLSHPDGIATRYIAPLVMDSSTGGRFGMKLERTAKSLYIPYDNDMYETYGAYTIAAARDSSEVGGIIEPLSGRGLILGSVSHDLWKTGVRTEGENNHLRQLSLFCGFASTTTRDTQLHGIVRGPSVSSPRMFVGFFDDYRNGLEAYGTANAINEPALPWDHGVPFGWNSWAAVGVKLDAEVYVTASDFIKDHLEHKGFGAEAGVYINFDAFWNNLSEEELLNAVQYVKKNGHKPGIYWTPFAYWSRDLDRVLEDGDGTWTVKDILLKDKEGNVLPPIDGGLPVDSTHPYVLEQIDKKMDQFAAWGFDYIKLDFLTHGALEGAHYNPDIPTGTAAYSAAMKRLADRVAPGRIGRPFFINLSIAPIFPYAFAHSRRISCDAFGHIDDTAYMLNSVSFGWWMNNTLYRFNDPDHTVLYQSYNAGPTTEEEAYSRFLASVVSGTVMMAGDDLRMPEARERAKHILGHPELNRIAANGRSFRPILSDIGEGASDVFVLTENDNSCYVAVFNYSDRLEAVKVISVETLGLSPKRGYIVTNVSTQQSLAHTTTFHVPLKPAEAQMFRIVLS